jgi:hypothetical protein
MDAPEEGRRLNKLQSHLCRIPVSLSEEINRAFDLFARGWVYQPKLPAYIEGRCQENKAAVGVYAKGPASLLEWRVSTPGANNHRYRYMDAFGAAPSGSPSFHSFDHRFALRHASSPRGRACDGSIVAVSRCDAAVASES